MSIFTTNLRGKMLPDVIAEIVEAWYQAQEISEDIEKDMITYDADISSADIQDKYKMSNATYHRILRLLKIKSFLKVVEGRRISFITSEDLNKLSPCLDAWRRGKTVTDIAKMIKAN
jgi:hypothetical protein